MHTYLVTRRRVLLVNYQRYLEADRAWDTALHEVKTWFPSNCQPSLLVIGNPGSKIRKIYEQRERALMQLEAAHIKLETARQRLNARRVKTQASFVVLLT